MLVQYVIYDHPADYPGSWVLRRWEMDATAVHPTDEASVYSTLEEARSAVPKGLVMLRRSPEDDPCIVETWT